MLRRLTPLSSPAATDSVAMPVMTAMSAICETVLLGKLPSTPRISTPVYWIPRFTCAIPSPSDVARPNSVAKTVTRSIT